MPYTDCSGILFTAFCCRFRKLSGFKILIGLREKAPIYNNTITSIAYIRRIILKQQDDNSYKENSDG
jgi:hypothetical protein